MSTQSRVADIDAPSVWKVLQSTPSATLIDVRTSLEWQQVGIPAMTDINQNLHLISWQFAPDMRVNTGFVDDLAAAGIKKGVPLYFLCRSGVRSRTAAEAADAAGYGPCFNVAEGFEGIAAPDGRRHGGWRGHGLPETTSAAST